MKTEEVLHFQELGEIVRFTQGVPAFWDEKEQN